MRRIYDTLTETEKNGLIISLNPVNVSYGVFKTIFNNTDGFLYNNAEAIGRGYYINHSGMKLVSKAYERAYDHFKNSIPTPDEDFVLSFTAQALGSNVIRPKFIDKWKRLYDVLLGDDYNPLDEFKRTESFDGSVTETITFDTSVGKTGENTDTTTYDTERVNDGDTSTREVTVTSRENSGDVYGFNSSSPVGDTVDAETSTETVSADPNDNKTHNVETKTGTDTKVFSIGETETKEGTETTVNDKEHTLVVNGRNKSAASMIEEEIKLRNIYQLFDIIYKDVDSIIALQIY